MTRIRFEDLPSTDTPINAENLDKLNNVVISPTTPTTGEEVWLQKGKNLFDKDSINKINAYLDVATSLIASSEHNRTLFIKCLPNTTYTIQKVVSGVFAVGYTNELPKEGVQVYNIINDATLSNATITTGSSAKYIVFRYYHTTNDTTYTEQQILDSLQIEIGESATSYEPYINKKIYTKNDNGVYEEFNTGIIEYTLANTPSHTSGTNNYSLTKNGNIVVLNVSQLWFNNIAGNTWTSLGNVPNILKPKTSKGSICTITDGGGVVVGFGKIDLTSGGLLQFKVGSNLNSSGVHSVTFEMTWTI